MPLDAWLVDLLPARGARPWFDLLMLAASTAGLLALAVGGPGWLRRRDRALGRACVLALLVGLGLSLALQLLCQRPRPAPVHVLLPVPPLPSFPSGHAVLVATAAVMIGWLRPRRLLVLGPVALLVALSRVHLGHHHPSDVAGGLLIGVGLGLGAAGLARSTPGDPWRWRWLLWPQLGLVLAISLVAYTGLFSRGNLPWLRWPGMDKALHLLLSGLLALWTHYATRGRALGRGPLRLPLAVVLPLLGGLGDEIMQAASPHRTADPGDLLADLIGTLLFWRVGVALTRGSGSPGPIKPSPTPRRPS